MFFNKSSVNTVSVLLKEKALKEEKTRALFRMKDHTAGREGEGW